MSLPFETKIEVFEDYRGNMRLMNPRNKLVTIAPEINSLITPEAKREAPGLRETWASEENLSPDPRKPMVESLSVQDEAHRV